MLGNKNSPDFHLKYNHDKALFDDQNFFGNVKWSHKVAITIFSEYDTLLTNYRNISDFAQLSNLRFWCGWALLGRGSFYNLPPPK